MLEVRRSLDRGYADHGWLKSYHTFSFADYYDPVFEDFGALRVINEDRIKPGKGYDNQPHRDVEILTYVLAGELEHKDSLGNAAVIRPGDVQRLSAGAGVTQSELNRSPSQEVHLLQIWIKPSAEGLEPGYEQKRFTASEKRGRLRLVASLTGEDDSCASNRTRAFTPGSSTPPSVPSSKSPREGELMLTWRVARSP